MKNFSIGILIVLSNVLNFFYLQAQEVTQFDSIKKGLDQLIASKNPADQQVLNEKLKGLAASNHEGNVSIAASYYYQLKNKKAFDSLITVQLVKFPKGLEARIRTQQTISAIKSLSEMEKAYLQFVKDFPANNYQKLPFGEDKLPYDRLRINLAIGYAKKKDLRKVAYYAGLLEADFWKCKAYSDLANTLYTNGDVANAALYQKRAVESAFPFANGKQGNSVTAKFAAARYASECAIYAKYLYQQKKYNDALKYIEVANGSINLPKTEVNYTYACILAAFNRNEEAYTIIEAVVKSGKATEEMSELFKKLYIKVKGSNVGLDNYQEIISKGVEDELRARLIKMMMNEPAPNFTLTDLEGNQVSLGSLKGKVVVLDFWATWCVPCKASFPGMQMAVDKFKNDPNVKFLFIHTWERVANPIAEAKTYIEGMKYNFHVLMDLIDPETRSNKVVESYQVGSIPTKFVIDQNGHIRFRIKGADASKIAMVDEITMMIELARRKI